MKQSVNFAYILTLSIIAAFGGFLFGYDVGVISGAVQPVGAQFSLTVMEQGWFVGCATMGAILGALIAGQLSDRFGRKSTLITAALLFAVSGIFCAFADTFQSLVFARMIGGLGVGVVSVVAPLYISEISVASYRGQLVGLYQLAVTIGFVASFGANYGLLQFSESGASFGATWMQNIFVDESWRAMLGVSSVPSIIFLLVVLFIPESPRWHVLKGQHSKALAMFGKIYLAPGEAEAQLKETREVVETGSTNEWQFLTQPGIMRAVIIGVCIAILGQFMGVNAVLYYGPKIFEEAGLSGGDALFSQILVGIVNCVTTIIAVFIIDKVGRKTLVYYGVSGMILSLLMIGTYFQFGTQMGLSNTFLLVFFLLYVFCCAISISAVIFVFLSEMYPTRVRGLAMSIAGFALWVGTYLVSQLTPWLLENATPAGTFFLFALMCLPYIYIVWRLMPDTTGKSLEEIERFWLGRNGNK